MSDAARVTIDFRAETVTIEGPSGALSKLFDAIHSVMPNLEVRIIPARSDAPAVRPVASSERSQPPSETVGRETTRTLFRQAERRARQLAEMAAERSSGPNIARMESLARLYAPGSTVDRIALLAYVAKAHMGAHFSSQDMEAWFSGCGFELPPSMAVALNDAHSKAKILDRVDRNNWALSAGGLERISAMRLSQGQAPP